MFSEATILVVKGDSDQAENIARALRGDYHVIGPEEPDDALSQADKPVEVVITELDTAHFSGLEFLRAWKDQQPRTHFIVFVPKGDVTTAVQAMKFGASDCLEKPLEMEKLRTSLTTVLSLKDGTGMNREWKAELMKSKQAQIEIPPGTSLEELERAAVERALALHHGNRTHAARTLGISVRTLQRKLKAWGMPLWSQNHPGNPGKPLFLTSQGMRVALSRHAHP